MNTQQIIEAVKALPRSERIKLVLQLGMAARIDADYQSTGHPENTEAYDILMEDAKPEPTLAETYAATAEKAITPESVNKEVVTGAGLQAGNDEKKTDA